MSSRHRVSCSAHLVIGLGLLVTGACYEGTGALGTTGASTAGSGGTGDPGRDGLDHEVVTQIPVGEDGVLYEGVDRQDMLPRGPSAFAVGPDGSLWLADGVRRRVLVHDRDTGLRRESLALDGLVEHIGALAVTADAVYVLDFGSRTRLARVDRGDGSFEVHELPEDLQRERGVTGMLLAEDGAVLVDLDGGAAQHQVVDADGRFAVQPGALRISGHRVRVRPGDPTGAQPGQGGIEIDGVEVIEISLPGNLIGARALGGWADGSFAVTVQELALVDGVIRIDERVRKYNVHGALLGEARLHTDRNYLDIGQHLALGADGSVYHAAPREEYVELQRLSFAAEPLERALSGSPILFAPEEELDKGGQPVPLLPFTVEDCLSSEQMLATADTFAGHEQTYTQANISGDCPGREAPWWLTEAGKSYKGVAYDWGGMSSVEEYVAALANGLQAGDMSGNVGCSVGVDCVGLMMHVWDIPLPKIWSGDFLNDPNRYHHLGKDEALVIGDGFVKPGHIMMFAGFHGGNLPVIADANGEDERVVRVPRDWKYTNGYKPIRYHKHCVNFCVDGAFAADPQVKGGTLEVAGTVSAPKGLLRYSLVVDALQPPHWTENYQEVAFEDAFAADVDIDGLAPGMHTLGLWVKDVDNCAKLVDTRTFHVQAGPYCGNLVKEPGEACDGADLEGQTCESQGYNGGTLGCTGACALDVSACTSDGQGLCGNGWKEPGEACDQDDLGGQTCASQGYQGGALACTQTCALDMSACTDDAPTQCQNGEKEPGEDCDGFDLGGTSCTDLGWSGGDLGCSGACTFDTSGCVNEPMCSYDVSPDGASYNAPYDCTGGVVMPISGSIDPDTGALSVASPSKAGDFGPGTYRVLVFDPNDATSDQCKEFNTVKSQKVLDATATSLTFPAFDSLLVCSDAGDAKAYCIAKEDGGDKAYWCSGRLVASYQ